MPHKAPSLMESFVPPGASSPPSPSSPTTPFPHFPPIPSHRKKPNFIFLNISQFLILCKRHIVTHLSTPISSITRLIIPSLFLVFLLVFRLALLSQEESDAKQAQIVDFDAFSLREKFGPSLPAMKFLYSHTDCKLDVCDSGELLRRVTSKLGVSSDQVLATTVGSYQIEEILRNETFSFIGGVMFSMLSSTDTAFKAYYGLDYTVIYNNTKLNKNAFVTDGKETQSDISLWIHKAVLDVLAELSLEYYGNYTATESPKADTRFVVHPFPVAPSQQLGSDSLYHNLLPLCALLSLFIVAIQAHYALNQDRQSQARVGMRMMGLRQNPYWCSWCLLHATFVCIGAVLFIVFGFIFQINWISLTNPLITFTLLFLMGMNLVANFFCCSICCTSTRSTNVHGFLLIFASLMFFAIFSPILAITQDKSTQALVTPGVLIYSSPISLWMHTVPSVNFFKICLDITTMTQDRFNPKTLVYERGPGFGFAQLFENFYPSLTTQVTGVPCTALNLLFLAVITVVYFMITIYFDNILPQSPGGTTLPFYYPLLPSYWGFSRLTGSDNLGVDVAKYRQDKFSSVLVDTDEDIYNEYQNVVGALDSDVGGEQEMPMKIIKLSKTYTSFLGLHSGGNKTALDSLTFSCNRDQVTVLLGHNGSGKSTTINILTGVIPASSGDALFSGYSVIKQMDLIRSDIGVCMQQDIIFEGMSGYQMMQLFAVIKGIPWTKLHSEIKEKLNMVKLWKFRNQKAATYSGGMKRRLSLAVACLGDPKHLILDEISSGVDPAARRLLWDILGKLKQQRAILLATHDLNEAELIADKVVILALGRCRGIGTTQHLRERFGGGFTVRTVTEYPDLLKTRVQEIIPEVEVESEAHGSIDFALPLSITPNVVNFFNFLEQQTRMALEILQGGPDAEEQKAGILVKDFDLTQTTLEQIFLRLTHGGKNGIYGRRNRAATQQMAEHLQLNIAVENQEGCIGCVNVSQNMSLERLRGDIARYCHGAPSEFIFLSNGVPLSRAQEGYRYAHEFMPLMVIRPIVGGGVGAGEQFVSAPTQDQSQEVQRLRNLTEQLQHQNAQLREMMEAMRLEMEALKRGKADEVMQEEDLITLGDENASQI